MINDKMYETCKDCPYYFGEINWCMYGEENVPDDLEKKCEVKNDKRRSNKKSKRIFNRLHAY